MATQKRTKHTGRIIASVTIILVLVAAAVLIGPTLLARRMAAGISTIKQATAKAGTIEKTATGTGHVAADVTAEDILASAGVVIDQIIIEAGDVVQKGEVLATLDETALQLLIWDKQAALAELDARLDNVKNDPESVYIRSTISGRIKQIFADEGDDVAAVMREHGALMVLSGDGRMVVRFSPVNPALANDLVIGDDVTVILADGAEKDGEFSRLSQTVWEVTISDLGPNVGEKVSIQLDDETMLGEGLLEISRPLVITGTDGQVEDILREVDDRVQIDSTLFRLTRAPESRDAVRLYHERSELISELNRLLAYSQAPVLVAPDEGTIMSVLIESGQTVSASSLAAKESTGTADDRAVVMTMEKTGDLQLKVDIDELDVAALAVGQPAVITVDALPSLEVSGIIADIAEDGTIGPSGTTFAVTLDLSVKPMSELDGDNTAAGLSDQSLKTGMSATATITVDRREQVITLPLEALQEAGDESFVYVGQTVDETNLGEKRPVVTGISDGSTVEIVTGLAAGETVNYRYVTGDESFMPFGNRNFRDQAESSTQD